MLCFHRFCVNVCVLTNCKRADLLPDFVFMSGEQATSGLEKARTSYRLDEQVGYLLRRAQQRHLSIFSTVMPGITPTQFAALAKLFEGGPLSQNELGRRASMDAATIKGVVDRLRARGLVSTSRDSRDQRRIYLDLTSEGRKVFETSARLATEITRRTVSGLTPEEHTQLIALLKKLA